MSYQNKKIVETLLSLRKNNRLSQKEVGEKIGMSQQTISDIENFKHTIDDEILYKYAMTFNVSADYILGLVSEPTTKLELKYFCKHTGLNEKTVELLNECVTREANGFIDFLKMLIYRIATNDTLLFDFDDVRENKTTYILTAKSLITKDISKLNNKQLDFVDALGTIERLKNDGHILFWLFS